MLDGLVNEKQQPFVFFFSLNLQGQGKILKKYQGGGKCFWELLCLGSERSFIGSHFDTTDINLSSLEAAT